MVKLTKNKSVVFYSAVNKSTKITGGIKRFRELIVSFLNDGYIVHLFAPFTFNLSHQNLLVYKTKSYQSRIIPNGLLNLCCNYHLLRKIKKISYQSLVVFEITYAIQCCAMGLPNIVIFLRQDIYRYRTVGLKKNYLATIYKIIYKSFIKILEMIIIRRTRNIFVQCHFDETQLLNRHNGIIRSILIKKIKVIPNNVNVSWITDIQNGEIIEYSDDFTIGFLGSVNDPRKGLDILLDSVEILLKKGFNIKLLVAGDGILSNHYQKEFYDFPQIRFLGYQKNSVTFIKSCDLMVVPSLEDSFPNVILESLYLEVPVIGSRRGGIPEILKYDDLLFNLSVYGLVNKLIQIVQENNMQRYKNLVIQRKSEFSFDWGKRVINTILGNPHE